MSWIMLSNGCCMSMSFLYICSGDSNHYWLRRQGPSDLDRKDHCIMFLCLCHLLFCPPCCKLQIFNSQNNCSSHSRPVYENNDSISPQGILGSGFALKVQQKQRQNISTGKFLQLHVWYRCALLLPIDVILLIICQSWGWSDFPESICFFYSHAEGILEVFCLREPWFCHL